MRVRKNSYASDLSVFLWSCLRLGSTPCALLQIMSLRFKGDPPKKKKRKERPDGGKADAAADEEEEEAQIADYSSDPAAGTGALMSSGVVVMGLDTDFVKELEVGDTLLVTVNDRFRNTSTDEARVVNMVLGKTSLNVNAPFSCDITSAAPFMFVKKQPDLEKLRAAKREKKRKEKERVEESRQVSYKVSAPAHPRASPTVQIPARPSVRSPDCANERAHARVAPGRCRRQRHVQAMGDSHADGRVHDARADARPARQTQNRPPREVTESRSTGARGCESVSKNHSETNHSWRISCGPLLLRT